MGKIEVVHVVHFASVALEAPETREKDVPLLIFDPLGEPKYDGDSPLRVPVLKNILGVFLLIYEGKWGQNGVLTCGDAKISIEKYRYLFYNFRKSKIFVFATRMPMTERKLARNPMKGIAL